MFTDAFYTVVRASGCNYVPDPGEKEKGIRSARGMYDACRNVLKEELGICLFDEVTLNSWFANRYSSQREDLQSEDWMTSWTKQKTDLYDKKEEEEEKEEKEEEEKEEKEEEKNSTVITT